MTSSEPSIPSKGVDGPQGGKSNGGRADATKLAQDDSKDKRAGSMGSTELADMALLIAEVKGTNRLLKALVAGKLLEHLPTVFKPQNESQHFEESKRYFKPYNEWELKKLTLDHILGVERLLSFASTFYHGLSPDIWTIN